MAKYQFVASKNGFVQNQIVQRIKCENMTRYYTSTLDIRNITLFSYFEFLRKSIWKYFRSCLQYIKSNSLN